MTTQDYRPIETAPRDGSVIEVFDEDCGSFAMRWNPAGFNPLTSTQNGIWESFIGHFTWSEDRGFGPRWWRPISIEAADYGGVDAVGY